MFLCLLYRHISTPLNHMAITQKTFGKYKEPLTEMPNLVEAQRESFEWLLKEGVADIFSEFSPISDYSGKKFDLSFSNITIIPPEYDEHYAKENKISYEGEVKATVELHNKVMDSKKEQEVSIAQVPMMTDHGTFIVNGVERVIVPQLIRSFGVLFASQEKKGKRYFGAKIIPSRGAWIEVESDQNNALYVRIDRKRKFAISALLRVVGDAETKDILKAFKDSPESLEYIKNTIEKYNAKNIDESYLEIYKKLRDGELATIENAREFIGSIFGDERYDLSEVGRFRFNQRFGLPLDKKATDKRTITLEDMVIIIKHIVELNATPGAKDDDVDDLASRRVRYVGEMLHQKLRVGLSRMKRNIQDRMSIVENDTTLPIQFVNARPLQAQIKEFYTTNQLSQFMQQDNALSEVEHLRILSALGPGGLTRERAGFEVRDVHTSHYGRLCPIHTPEGPNIGLILHLSSYARINDFGMIETPYVKVENGKITGEIKYMTARDESGKKIAHAALNYDGKGVITDAKVEVRVDGRPALVSKKEVDLMDVATNQAYSIATSMIPFLNHNDQNRALMGSNMQKQAVPCVKPQAPLVATGMEEKAARDSGRLVLAVEAGTVTEVDARHIVVKNTKGKETKYRLITFSRTNKFTNFHQRPIVNVGEKIKKGQVLADTSSSEQGQMALGQNLRVAFMSWSGMNFEDAIIVSERLVKENVLTSIHIEEFVVPVRDTKLGPEVTTSDIPNVGEGKLANLDEEGIIRIGSEVRPGDILVGKITPKGESQLTPEERLLRSIFGEKARDVKTRHLDLRRVNVGELLASRCFPEKKATHLNQVS